MEQAPKSANDAASTLFIGPDFHSQFRSSFKNDVWHEWSTVHEEATLWLLHFWDAPGSHAKQK